MSAMSSCGTPAGGRRTAASRRERRAGSGGGPPPRSSSAAPPARTKSAGRWPALPYTSASPRTCASSTVAMCEERTATRFSRASVSIGPPPSIAYARSAARSSPISVAARRPLPATSPMTTATSPEGSGSASYQSPPTSTPAPGTKRAASSSPGTLGSRSGSSERCSVSAIRRARALAQVAAVQVDPRDFGGHRDADLLQPHALEADRRAGDELILLLAQEQHRALAADRRGDDPQHLVEQIVQPEVGQPRG